MGCAWLTSGWGAAPPALSTTGLRTSFLVLVWPSVVLPLTSLCPSVFTSFAAGWSPVAAAGSTGWLNLTFGSIGTASTVRLATSASANSLVQMISNRARQCPGASSAKCCTLCVRSTLDSWCTSVWQLMCRFLYSLSISEIDSTLFWHCPNSTFHHELVFDLLRLSDKPLITSKCSSARFNFPTQWASFHGSASFDCLAVRWNQLNSANFGTRPW